MVTDTIKSDDVNDSPLTEREMLIYWLLRCYEAARREGHEEGPTEGETLDSLLSVLTNLGYDPNLSINAATLLRHKPVFHVPADGVELIGLERQRQIRDKGYTPRHDDQHDLGELGLAAALFALPYDAKVLNQPLLKQDDFIALHICLETGCNFYVDPEPDPIRRLTKAGALIAAEIDRRRRLAKAIATFQSAEKES